MDDIEKFTAKFIKEILYFLPKKKMDLFFEMSKSPFWEKMPKTREGIKKAEERILDKIKAPKYEKLPVTWKNKYGGFVNDFAGNINY